MHFYSEKQSDAHKAGGVL